MPVFVAVHLRRATVRGVQKVWKLPLRCKFPVASLGQGRVCPLQMSNFLWHRELFVLELRADAEPVTSFPSFSILKQPPTHSWLKGPPELVTSLGQVKPLWPLPHSEKQSWYFKLFAPLRALTHPRLLWKWFRLGVLQYYKNSGFGHLAYTLTYPDTTRYLFTIRMKLPYLVLNCHTDVCTLPYV